MKDEDLNFPQAEYSPEELPASIADLADFIKEEQVLFCTLISLSEHACLGFVSTTCKKSSIFHEELMQKHATLDVFPQT